MFDMQLYPIHAEGTSFVQPNEARHIQTGVLRFRKKAKTPYRRNEGGSSGVAGNPGCPHRQRGAHAGAERIFTIRTLTGPWLGSRTRHGPKPGKIFFWLLHPLSIL